VGGVSSPTKERRADDDSFPALSTAITVISPDCCGVAEVTVKVPVVGSAVTVWVLPSGNVTMTVLPGSAVPETLAFPSGVAVGADATAAAGAVVSVTVTGRVCGSAILPDLSCALTVTTVAPAGKLCGLVIAVPLTVNTWAMPSPELSVTVAPRATEAVLTPVSVSVSMSAVPEMTGGSTSAGAVTVISTVSAAESPTPSLTTRLKVSTWPGAPAISVGAVKPGLTAAGSSSV